MSIDNKGHHFHKLCCLTDHLRTFANKRRARSIEELAAAAGRCGDPGERERTTRRSRSQGGTACFRSGGRPQGAAVTRGGRPEEFDSDRLTHRDPFPGRSVLSDLVLFLEDDGLWLELDYYGC